VVGPAGAQLSFHRALNASGMENVTKGQIRNQSFTQCQIGEEIFPGAKEGTRKFYGVK
jgi:hypothetical protein